MQTFRPRIVLSDIDGTLVHYTKPLEKLGYTIRDVDSQPTSLKVLASSCGGAQVDSGEGKSPKLVVEFVYEGGSSASVVSAASQPQSNLSQLPGSSSMVIPVVEVPSLTRPKESFISIKTLELVDHLRRQHGIHFALLTGARTSTLMQRRESGTLPLSDFYVCEGGGKIFRGNSTVPDKSWIERFNAVTGALGCLDVPASNSPAGCAVGHDGVDRAAPLWQLYDRLLAHFTKNESNIQLDAKDYHTGFMIDVRKFDLAKKQQQQPPGEEETATGTCETGEEFLKRVFRSASELSNHEEGLGGEFGVELVMNLGKGHVNAKGCNKESAATYILDALGGIQWQEAVALFDDENDLCFAQHCGMGFIPSVAHPSVLDAVQSVAIAHATAKVAHGKSQAEGSNHDTRRHVQEFRLMPVEGFIGTEAALEGIIQLAENAKVSHGSSGGGASTKEKDQAKL